MAKKTKVKRLVNDKRVREEFKLLLEYLESRDLSIGEKKLLINEVKDFYQYVISELS